MADKLHGIIQTEIARLQKAEWLSAYVRARAWVFSTLNILSAFSGAGLFPFNPQKVLGRIPSSLELEIIPDGTTPEPDISPLEHPLLTSSPPDSQSFGSQIMNYNAVLPIIQLFRLRNGLTSTV